MDMLVQLGVNKTYFIQLAIFVFTLFILSQHVFKDFAELLEKRDLQTKGSEDLASEEQGKTIRLHKAYEEKARWVSGEIKTIFDSYRQEANAEFEKIIAQARGESNKLMEESRQRLAAEIGDAARKLAEEAPLVAKAMSSKLLSGQPGGRT